MSQLTVKDLKKILEEYPDELEVFFRRVAPICGNIEAAGFVNKDKYSTFGQIVPCIIIEPMSDK